MWDRGHDHVAETYIDLHVNSGMLQPSHEIDAEVLVFLYL